MNEPPGAAMFNTPASAYDRHVGRYGAELGRDAEQLVQLDPPVWGGLSRLRSQEPVGANLTEWIGIRHA